MLISLFLACLIIINAVASERIFHGNPYSHRENLDPEGKFILEWIADPKNSDVVFNITAETLGYVALGFSKTGMMAKSDMVITGVNNKGKPYLSDRYTKMESRFPIEDIEQNWKIVDAWENETHTSVSIVRDMDTCDRQDYPFNDDTIYILWAYGEDDTFDYHFTNRGSFPTHILQPDLSPQLASAQTSSLSQVSNRRRLLQNGTRSQSPQSRNPSPNRNPESSMMVPPMETGLDVWRLTSTVNSSASNGPWCVFQKGPELPKMNTIIGFSTSTQDEKVLKNLDRLVIYKCFPKQDQNGRRVQRQEQEQSQDQQQEQSQDSDKKFEELVDYSGECINATELYSYCTDIVYTWGNGGRDIFLPKNVGVPFGGQDEYYLLESFLIPKSQNKSSDANGEDKEGKSEQKTNKEMEFDVDVDFLLTENPRKYTAKILKVGYDPMSPILIPPGARNFEVYGHCPNECTSKLIPRTKPIRVFGVSFDTGQAAKAKSVTLHHFRNAFEIPTIHQNRNHDPKFQEMQILRDSTPVRPEDQLTVRCKFDSNMKPPQPQSQLSSNSKSTSPSPLSPESSPRCLAYLWYYQDFPVSNSSTSNGRQLLECTSKIHPSDFAFWVEQNAPPEMKRNIDSPYILNKLKKLKWTQFLLMSLGELYEFGRYRASCGVPSPAHKTGSSSNLSSRRLGSAVSSINRNNPNRVSNGTTGRRGPQSFSSRSSAAASSTGEITVRPLPVEEIPETMGGGSSACPTFRGRGRNGAAAGAAVPPAPTGSGPLFFGLPPGPGPVIFGFP